MKQQSDGRSKGAVSDIVGPEALQALFDSHVDAIFIADAETGIIVAANHQAERLTGRRQDELIGMHQSQLHPPELAEHYRQQFRSFFTQDEFVQEDILVRHRDGHDTPVSIRGSLVISGKRRFVQGIFRDISEQKRHEERMRQSESRFRALFEGSPVPIWEEDFSAVKRRLDSLSLPEGIDLHSYLTDHPEEVWHLASLVSIVDINQQSVTFFGVSSKDEIWRHLPDYFDEQALAAFAEEMAALYGGATRFNTQIPIKTMTGETRELMLHLSIAPGSEQGWERVYVSFIDISEQQRMVETIRASEQRYRSLFNNILEGFGHHRMLFDDAGRPQDYLFLDVNAAFGALTGLHDVVGKRVSEVIPGIRETSPELFEIYGRVAAGGPPERFETYVEKLQRWFSVSVYSTGPNHFVTLFDNISKRKMAEKRLQDELLFRRKLIESAAEGICMWRPCEAFPYIRFVVWNRRMQELTGYTMQEINELGWYQSLYADPESQNLARERMFGVLAGKQLRSKEIEVTTKSGQLRLLRLSSTQVAIGDETPGVLGILEDISEQRQLETELRQMQKIEALGTLVGGIAHDFNNILSGMLGSIFLAQTEVEDRPQALEDLQVAERLGFRAADLITQLLTFARKGRVNKQSLELAGFLRDTFGNRLVTVPENIRLTLTFGDDPLPVVADSTQIQQIVMNLLSNARDALQGRENPQISVRLQRFEPGERFLATHNEVNAGAFAHLSVEDNGSGIPPENIERVFEPFFTTKEIGKGTGLGLATLYGIVRGHDGVLDVESVQGSGTTFHIYLPLAAGTAVTAAADEEPREIPRGAGELILLIDDEQDVRASVAEVLKRLGYSVVTAADGKQALKLFAERHEQVALVILDVVMPGLSGPETARRMRETKPQLPIIFSTGYDIDNTLPAMGKVNVGNVLAKPFRVDVLGRKIDLLLREHDMKR